ncbi:hypothetical protein HF086_006865 [Spodoptera exigua]|uniref:Cytochrome p450 n=1 Tax=Spodoptera exigua TaxID=7107 RepID=A0A922MAY8_SPOEX|nr:hypothetical protein HF086_006865 [Spodoptera exigua]
MQVIHDDNPSDNILGDMHLMAVLGGKSPTHGPDDGVPAGATNITTYWKWVTIPRRHTTYFYFVTEILKNLWTLADLAFKHKNSAKLWLGPKLYVAIGDPEDAQVVLENCLDKDVVYRFLRPWLGHGLFVAPETAMGERMDVQHSPDTPYLRARHTVMEILNMRLFKVWLQPDCIFNLTPYAKQQRDNIDLTHKFTDEVVKKKRLEYERKKGDHKEQNDGKLRAVLDLLFGREIEFTDEQLREHIDSITIAGNDTTALVIAYTLVLLGIHQDAQERVLQEMANKPSMDWASTEELLFGD